MMTLSAVCRSEVRNRFASSGDVGPWEGWGITIYGSTRLEDTGVVAVYSYWGTVIMSQQEYDRFVCLEGIAAERLLKRACEADNVGGNGGGEF